MGNIQTSRNGDTDEDTNGNNYAMLRLIRRAIEIVGLFSRSDPPSLTATPNSPSLTVSSVEEFLPPDMIQEILCLLPVKPLKRFRCVENFWKTMIDSEIFANWHVKKSLETNSHRHLVYQNRPLVYQDGRFFYQEIGYSGALALDISHRGIDYIDWGSDTFLKPPGDLRHLSSSCNGLFLIMCNSDDLFLWNPFTTEYKHLPVLEDDFDTPSGCQSSIVYGFAYDSRNDDYMVVRVLSHRSEGNFYDWTESRAHIYSLNSNTWKQTAESFEYPVSYWYSDLNGALHTVCPEYPLLEDCSKSTIMAFSVESERHYEVQLPLGISRMKNVCLELHKLGGCLSLCCVSKSEVEVWVMKDYRVRESWTKIASMLHIRPPIGSVPDGKYGRKPLVYAKNGDKVLLFEHPRIGCSCFYWKNLTNYIYTHDPATNYVFLEACVASLVSLHREQVQDQVHHHANRKNKKFWQIIRDDFLGWGSCDSRKIKM